MDKPHRYAICISDHGDEFSVQKGKLYRLVDPEPNDPPSMIRIVDEEGDDYLHDRSWFWEIEVPEAVAHALEEAA